MKKVLQIADYIYPCISGIGVVAMDIAQSLKESQIEQKIICINHDVVKGRAQIHAGCNVKHRVNGIEVIRCRMDMHVASQPLSVSYIRILNEAMKSFCPDVVIFHYPNPYMAHFLLKYRKEKFKLIVWWHSDIIRQKVLGKLFVKQNYDLLNRAQKVVATSENYIKGSYYLSKYQEKCVVIPNCIREEKRKVTGGDRKRAALIKPHGKIMCFTVGRHVAYKGLEYLIDAARYLDEGFEFYIASSGPLTKKLKKMTASDKRFHFTGRLNERDLKAYYYACDIFCFPSITKNEAFGLALADAMYYGKPAVTFTISGSGVNFVSIGGKTGIECRNRDSRAYAEALKRLADDEKLRKEMGENAHQRALDMFTFRKFRTNLLNMICQVAGKDFAGK